MNITVFGSGYVGLVTGACLADVGHKVLCVDIDPIKIERLKGGDVGIYEPGLSELVARNQAQGRLGFTTDAATAINTGEVIFIAVGTPSDEDGSADLKHVLAVAKSIGEHMSGPKVVVDKSTVPVGTADLVKSAIATELEARGESIEFHVCSNPEFLKEGAALEDFSRAPRIVVGTDSEKVRQMMRVCYAPYNRNHDKLIFMDVRSAELTKYAANAMLATRISFMNEMASLAEELGADIDQVRIGIGSDPRIGFDFLYAGAGYGGSCFPKDVRALIHTAKEIGRPARLLEAVQQVNAVQQQWLFDTLARAMAGLSDRNIAVWGLSFKPNTNDMREAPSRVLINALLDAGARIVAFDPKAADEAKHIWKGEERLTFADSPEHALADADALVICTEWKLFRSVDFSWLKRQLRAGVVVDGRNLYDPEAARAAGLKYISVGRPKAAIQ